MCLVISVSHFAAEVQQQQQLQAEAGVFAPTAASNAIATSSSVPLPPAIVPSNDPYKANRAGQQKQQEYSQQPIEPVFEEVRWIDDCLHSLIFSRYIYRQDQSNHAL